MYHALIESALQFLSTFKRDSNKTRDLYKRLELALRADGPRLTACDGSRRSNSLSGSSRWKTSRAMGEPKRSIRLRHTVVREPQKTQERFQLQPEE